MSVLLRTIEAFPTGRTTNELFALLDVDFDPRKRVQLHSELAALVDTGKISKGRDGRWRPIVVAPARSAGSAPPRETNVLSSPTLNAAPAFFFAEATPAESLDIQDLQSPKDPAALMRYFRSALRADPRGAMSQVDDRHGVQWHLVSGSGPLVAKEDHVLRIRIGLDDLADEFRKALVKREGNEQAVAIGWPIAIAHKNGAPVIWPVGLISADWYRSEKHLELIVDGDDVLVNPEWLKGAARSAGWTEKSLREVFLQAEGVGLPLDDFLARLKEVAAGAFRGKIAGRQLATEIDPASIGIYDAAAIFLPTDSTFTAGAGRDLDRIAVWPKERLARTALAPLLGLQSENEKPIVSAINIDHRLNKEQILAVQHSLVADLTVVTGPPGTGKSQAVVSMVASVLQSGGSVLVASKNHQALDAVEERLSGIAEGVPFVVRTLNPARDIDQSFSDVLVEIIRGHSAPGAPPDQIDMSRLATIAQQRTASLGQIDEIGRIRCDIADIVERLEARAQLQMEIPVGKPTAPSFLARLVATIIRLVGRKGLSTGSVYDVPSEGAPTVALVQYLGELRTSLHKLGMPADPVALTHEIGDLVRRVLPRMLRSRTAVGAAKRQQLADEHANLELAQESGPLPGGLARDVLTYRPLWLASVLGAPKRIPLDDGLFDLVIFDEASQCDIASALPLFARAKRAVVVGDDRQLSFISQLGIAHDRNLMQAQGLPLASMGRFAQSRRSLFDFASSTPGAVRITLRDQYRSATSIVEYINGEFYGGQLRVAADQENMRAPPGQKPGMAWTDVPAPSMAMQGNVNPAEVSAIVAQLRLLLVEQQYSGSIGVIAPFRPQVQALTDAIHQAIPEALRETTELRIGTVDSFQGQERDLILFSPCLAQSSATSAISFIQKDWRRLNVAISRARAMAHVFGDLAFARSGKVRSLQRLARIATEPKPRVAEGTFDSEWERRVFHALRERGYKPIPQFEEAGRRLDFALFGAGDIKLDLEIDGRYWHSDIDGKRKISDLWRDKQLQSLGWRVQRFWVDELAANMGECLDVISKRLS